MRFPNWKHSLFQDLIWPFSEYPSECQDFNLLAISSPNANQDSCLSSLYVVPEGGINYLCMTFAYKFKYFATFISRNFSFTKSYYFGSSVKTGRRLCCQSIFFFSILQCWTVDQQSVGRAELHSRLGQCWGGGRATVSLKSPNKIILHTTASG